MLEQKRNLGTLALAQMIERMDMLKTPYSIKVRYPFFSFFRKYHDEKSGIFILVKIKTTVSVFVMRFSRKMKEILRNS